MKKSLLLSVGLLLLLVIFAMWVYLLLFDTPKNTNDIFADLGFSEREEGIIEATPQIQYEPLPETAINVGNAALTQLTVRPVAGFAFVEESPAAPDHIRYAERGVGYVYDINLSTGHEERVLGKTFTAVQEAIFAPNGSAVVLMAEAEGNRIAYLEEIGSEDVLHTLPTNIADPVFITSTDLRYSLVKDDGTHGYAYDLVTNVTTELFAIPFKDAKILWAHGEAYAINRPAPFLSGGIYRIEGSALRQVADPGYAFSALVDPTDHRYLTTAFNARTSALSTTLRDSADATSTMPIVMLREKCTFDPVNTNTAWCGAPIADLPRTFQTDWYKGVTASNDMLWLVDFAAAEGRALFNIEGETGRSIDTDGLISDSLGSYLMFSNRTDGSLWLYDLAFGNRTEPLSEDVETDTEVLE